jgi:hypothetical protein
LNAQTNLWMTDPIALKEYKLEQQLSHLDGFQANKVYYRMMQNAAPARRGAGRIRCTGGVSSSGQALLVYTVSKFRIKSAEYHF